MKIRPQFSFRCLCCLLGLFVVSSLLVNWTQAQVQGWYPHEKSFTQRWKAGEDMKSVRVPSGANREEVHRIINEQEPDILYLDLHHSPGTEWDMSRIVKAAQEKDIPVMCRVHR